MTDTDIPTPQIPPAPQDLPAAVAEALHTAATAAATIPAQVFDAGHPRAAHARLLGLLASITTQLATGLDTEHNQALGNPCIGARMTDDGMDAFLNSPFLQHLRDGPGHHHTSGGEPTGAPALDATGTAGMTETTPAYVPRTTADRHPDTP